MNDIVSEVGQSSAPPAFRAGFALPLLILLIVALGFAVVACAYWPGVMIDDARWQYQQAVDNSYEDWHPPLMAWIWRRMAFAVPGPAPMLLLQLLLYWGGIGLIAWWAYRRGERGLAVAIACAGWLPAPLALSGAVLKDVLMAGFLLCASGMLLCRTFVQGNAWRAGVTFGSILCLFVAAALRLNAVFACVPLLLAALPPQFTRTIVRGVLTTVLGTAAFLATGPAVSRLVQAENTKVNLSLMIFDIGGITERSGFNQFPDLGVRDPVRVNHQCYDPKAWDSYSTWAKRPCPIGFERFDALVDEGDVSVTRLWLNAIATHPMAYAEHRLDHFNRSAWFLVPPNSEPVAWSQSAPNPWGFQVRQNSLLAAVSRYANGAGATPFGWPIFWISIALAVLIASRSAASGPRAIAASAFLYGMSYLAVGVAVGLRYYFWTISGAALAALALAVELRASGARIGGGRLLASSAAVAITTLLAIAARMTLP